LADKGRSTLLPERNQRDWRVQQVLLLARKTDFLFIVNLDVTSHTRHIKCRAQQSTPILKWQRRQLARVVVVVLSSAPLHGLLSRSLRGVTFARQGI
jgi:hypothetical protein